MWRWLVLSVALLALPVHAQDRAQTLADIKAIMAEIGERIAEIPTAELLAVSRTPVRIAFRTLEQIVHPLVARGRVEDLAAAGVGAKLLAPRISDAFWSAVYIGFGWLEKWLKIVHLMDDFQPYGG